VLRLLVPPQVNLPLETFPTEVAAERLEAGVFPAVRDEVGALTEGLPAHLTLVRFLTCSENDITLEMCPRHFYALRLTTAGLVYHVSMTS